MTRSAPKCGTPCAVDAEFKEGDHPRASNGQFGSGSSVHIVTTHDADTGTTEFHHVGSDPAAAAEAHDRVANDDEEHETEGDDSAEYHAPKLKGGKKGDRSNTVHIVHSADGAGGVDIHGAHTTFGAAHRQASEASESEWDENGPERGDLDRNQNEEDEAALAWNAEHASGNDDVRIKVDADGDVERDDDGELQWVQDGEDIDPTDDHLAAFDGVFDEMYPADERAAYPGLDKANDHFEAEGRHEAVFRIHKHEAKSGDPAIASDAAVLQRNTLALDRATVRRVDADGHLHVERTPISKANVCDYFGSEIPGHDELGLDPHRIYRLWRHPDELQKAVPSAAGKPLFMGHRAVSAADHDHQNNVGSVTAPEWDAPYVWAALDVWPQTAIDAIESGRHAELSPAYRYTPDMTPGVTPNGEPYDGVMRDIDFSHVALVPEGRTGKDVRVMDAALPSLKPKDPPMSRTPAVPSRTAASARGAFSGGLAAGLAFALRSKLASDAKPDYAALVKGITAQNLRTRTPRLVRGLDAAIKGKLAKDEEMDAAAIQDVVEQVGELVTQSAPDIAAEVAPEAATTDEDDADLRAMLKAKGLTDEEIDMVCRGEMPKASSPPAEDEEAAKEAVKGMDAKIAAATREATVEARKGMIAVDAARQMAEDIADKRVADERNHNRSLREAEAIVLASPVGRLAGSQAFDSAADWYRGGLKALGAKNVEKLAEDGLKDSFEFYAGAAASRPAPTPRPGAMDSAAAESYATRFGANASRLKN